MEYIEASDCDKARILDALQDSDLGHDGMVTQFIIVFTSIDPNGKKWCHTRFGPDLVSWEARGMLAHALDGILSDDIGDEVEVRLRRDDD